MTKYLLDTHVVLWIAGNPAMLSETAKDAILDANAEKMTFITIDENIHKYDVSLLW